MFMPLDSSPSLSLAFGLDFESLYTVDGAAAIDAHFVAHLNAVDAALAARLDAARADPATLNAKQEAELLIAIGPHLEDFIGELFGVSAALRALQGKHHELAPLFAIKRQFVQRKALNAYKADAATTFDGAALRRDLEARVGASFSELDFANSVTAWQQDPDAHAQDLDLAMRYAAW